MTSVTTFEAKTRLSELIKKAQAGEEVVITSGREKTPVATITAIAPKKSPRLGFLEHLNLPPIPDSVWFDPLPEAWTGEDEHPGDPLLADMRKPVRKEAPATRTKRAERRK